MSEDSAHNKWWEISELVFGIPFILAIALEVLVPLAWPTGWLRLALIAPGAILIVLGIAIVVFARREFARYGEHTDPGHPTTKIMTTGIFSFSRNPLYLGIVIFIVGVALAFDLAWALIWLVPSIIACQYILIAPEERYLTAKFGEEYIRYTRSVQRWIGRSSR